MSSGGLSVKGRSLRGNNGGGEGGGTGTKCGRWNPTVEQLKVLTDLFRAGLRTPTTDQIQKISTELSFYGKIESKNVFYWFQNHKARERQKRRKISIDFDHHHHHYQENDIFLHHHIRQPSTKDVFEINEEDCGDEEKVIETLQLFPVNSLEDSKVEKMRGRGNNNNNNNNQYREYIRETNTTAFSLYSSCGAEMEHLPPLDLRLSFL